MTGWQSGISTVFAFGTKLTTYDLQLTLLEFRLLRLCHPVKTLVEDFQYE